MAITQRSILRSAVKHVVRQIAVVSNPMKGYKSVEEVDADLGSLILQGYRIVNTHFLRAQTDPENGIEFFGIMYILQLEPSEVELLKKQIVTKPAE